MFVCVCFYAILIGFAKNGLSVVSSLDARSGSVQKTCICLAMVHGNDEAHPNHKKSKQDEGSLGEQFFKHIQVRSI